MMYKVNRTIKKMTITTKLWVIAGLLALPYLIRYLYSHFNTFLQQIKTTKQENLLNDPKLQENEALTITQNKRLHAIAEELTHHLGTAYSWYNPKSWTENDKEVLNLLIEGLHYLPVIGTLYRDVYTSGRSLRMDVNKFLDTSEKRELDKQLKINNINW